MTHFTRTMLLHPTLGARLLIRAIGAARAAFRMTIALTRVSFDALAVERHPVPRDEDADPVFSRAEDPVFPLENRPNIVMRNVHPESACEGGTCPIHRRTAHALRSWPQHYRMDAGFMERLCPEHGVGHPDPDDVRAPAVHGCCGCCGIEFKRVTEH